MFDLSDPSTYMPQVQAALDAATPATVGALRAFLVAYPEATEMHFELAWNTDHAVHATALQGDRDELGSVNVGGLADVLERFDPDGWMDTFDRDDDLD